MRITFYKTISPKNKINKVLSDSVEVQGTLKKNTDILSPLIRFLNTTNFNVFDYNYCYISELNRYYFIDDITILSDTIFEVSLSVDVLMTYKTPILSLECSIKECSENTIYNKSNTIEDYNTNTILFNNPFTTIEDGDMVLVALNGGNV